MKAHEPFQPVQPASVPDRSLTSERTTEMGQLIPPPSEPPLRRVRPNIVQSIRAFDPEELHKIAGDLDQHFLYADLSDAHTRQEVLASIAEQFTFPPHFGKNYDALYDCMTDPLHKSGPQPGFIVVLEHIPATARFDKEAREQLLDIFRDAAEYWSDRQIPFRCFYSFL